MKTETRQLLNARIQAALPFIRETAKQCGQHWEVRVGEHTPSVCVKLGMPTGNPMDITAECRYGSESMTVEAGGWSWKNTDPSQLRDMARVLETAAAIVVLLKSIATV